MSKVGRGRETTCSDSVEQVKSNLYLIFRLHTLCAIDVGRNVKTTDREEESADKDKLRNRKERLQKQKSEVYNEIRSTRCCILRAVIRRSSEPVDGSELTPCDRMEFAELQCDEVLGLIEICGRLEGESGRSISARV